MMDNLRSFIKEGIFDFLKKKKQDENQEMRRYIADQINYFRLHADEHPPREEVMKFFQKLISDVEEKFGNICIPAVSKDQIEDLAGSYLQKYKLI